MSSLHDLLSLDAITVTPNQRLAQTLIQKWGAAQQNSVSKYPDCYAYKVWLHNLFNQVIENAPSEPHPILIDDLAAFLIWRKIITNQSDKNASMTLAERLYQSWCLCQTYRCPIKTSQFNHNHQTQWFAKMAAVFEEYLQKNNIIVESQLADYICQHADTISRKAVNFVCFDQLTPQQQHLLDSLCNQGMQVRLHDINRKPAVQVGKMIVADTRQEYQAWVDWLVKQHKSGKQSMAVILPNLQDCAKDVQRLLRYHFHPDQFNISMGQSLLEYPMISQALLLLHPLTDTCSDHYIRIFLTSPYIKGSPTEWLNRALLLESKRQLKQAVVPTQELLSQLEHSCPILYHLLQNLTPYPDIAMPSEWANCFHQRMLQFGFPGDYGLTSMLFQCYEKWQTVLTNFSLLDRVESPMTIQDALELLLTVLKRTIFQPQSASAPIQVLGMLEAAGCEFDALWMAGLTDLTLPATGQLTPFIPIPIQQQLGMPYASQEKEYQIAQKRLNRFTQSCDEFMVSYAHLSDDKPNMPSPLINHFSELPAPKLELTRLNDQNWQTYEDPLTIPLQEGESIRGGSRILANQAQCPFKAFAAHRLAIQDSEKAVDGLDNREKGTLIHLILQNVWQQLKCLDKLKEIEEDSLLALVNETIDSCIPQVFKHPQTAFEQSVIALEKNKLVKLIRNVLEEEKKRPPFHITAVEQTCQYDFEQFSIQLKFDRLDTIDEDGSKWVIDYKSTIPNGTPWLDDRPDDAQLLLYALLDEDIRSMSYMQIQTGSIKHRGFAEHPPPINGISAAKKKTWADYRVQWQSIVSELAKEFSQGIVQPKPKKSSICLNCPYGQLCRFPLQNEESE